MRCWGLGFAPILSKGKHIDRACSPIHSNQNKFLVSRYYKVIWSPLRTAKLSYTQEYLTCKTENFHHKPIFRSIKCEYNMVQSLKRLFVKFLFCQKVNLSFDVLCIKFQCAVHQIPFFYQPEFIQF